MTASAAARRLDVLIVGAGVSGIGMACTLRRHCPDKSFAVLDRRQQLGGTWDLFRYPGVRSDSDMHTYSYAFKPWSDDRVLADGQAILDYLAETVRENGIGDHIRYGHSITAADWSSTKQCWTVTATDGADGRTERYECRLLVMATGYFNHEAGHSPAFAGIEAFEGTVVHPQHWPADLDCAGKRVVVIGSGATAITLVPALAATAARVTMLQRSPTYILSLPSRDPVAQRLGRLLPRRWACAFARRRNIAMSRWIYLAARRWPALLRRLLLSAVHRQLRGSADMAHFTPRYMPWDQRLCVVPDGDLFRAIRSGKADVVTDEIAGFRGRGVVLRSGAEIDADILVTATGLEIEVLGGVPITVDGRTCNPGALMIYKATLMQDLPNLAWIFGYTNASWTLKADLSATYLCRLLQHMDAGGWAVAVARDDAGCRTDESVMGNLSSGYVCRASARMPRQGSRAPWRVMHDYPSDKVMLLEAPIDDGVLRFEPARPAGAPEAARSNAGVAEALAGRRA